MNLHDNPYGLSPLQWRFVQEYLVDLNATAAYLRAGYKCSTKAAEANGARQIRNDKVARAIRIEKALLADVVKLKQETVLEEIHLLSHSTIEHYQVDTQGNVVLAPGAPKNAMRAVASMRKKITHTPSGIQYETEIKLWNKPASVRMAGEHLDLFSQSAVKSQDIQSADAKRQAAVDSVKVQLQRIRERHAEYAQGGTA